MLENNRDEINYHKFLKSVRKSQGASLEKTGFGVYTKSGMSRIEAGTRLPDKLVRDRLTARLGISGEEYEEYLLPREYKQWQLRMEIIRCINKKDIAGAEEKIATYESLYNINSVEKQFVETMRFMVYEMKGYGEEVLQAQIYNALICTIPDIDAAFAGVQLLADQELNLIMEYVRLTTPEIPKINATEWRLKEYNNIVTYVETSRMDKIAQAKVYSKLACLVSELILTEYANEESLRYALDLCTKAVEVLRDTVRLYYFVELNEYRVKIIEKLFDLDGDNSKDLKELLNDSKEWAELFCELDTENNLPIYMDNFTYLYTETECNNVSDVIRARREMMGLTRAKFCNNICDERTVMRIENEKGNPSMSVVRAIFDRIGLCAEYKRAGFITSNVEAFYLAERLATKMNGCEYEKALILYEEIYKLIDADISYNEQELKRLDAIILRANGKITAKEHEDILVDAMECTMAIETFLSDSNKYLTRAELSCVNDFATYTEDLIGNACREFLNDMCLNIVEMKDVEAARLCVYELMMVKSASYLGDIGRYEESSKISRKLLKESLRNKRVNLLMICIYNELWNRQKIEEQKAKNIDAEITHNSLTRGLMLSVICKNPKWEQFFQHKLNTYISE